jgi:tryptophan-rich sensory protein
MFRKYQEKQLRPWAPLFLLFVVAAASLCLWSFILIGLDEIMADILTVTLVILFILAMIITKSPVRLVQGAKNDL